MTTSLPTTSFGRRTPSLGQAAAAAAVRAAAAAPEPVHKWRLLRALTEGRAAFGLPERALTVLHALLAFHPETALTLAGEAAIVVFPSTRELSLRANGMPETTLRRHLAALVEAGLVARRDSPNGKRFVRRSEAGEVLEAYGFDLAPFVAAAKRIEAAAAEARARIARIKLLRARVTLMRRDCVGASALLLERGGADAEALAQRLAQIPPTPRRPDSADLESLADALAGLSVALDRALAAVVEDEGRAEPGSAPGASLRDNALQDKKMSGSAIQPGGAYQNQNQTIPDSEPASNEDRSDVDPLPGNGEGTANPALRWPVGALVSAFPALRDYAPTGRIADVEDFARAAEIARAALGVSPDAWRAAREGMGAGSAAIAVAAILERGEAVRSPGGYLRALTAQARAGRFAVGPLVVAGLRAKGSGRSGRPAA